MTTGGSTEPDDELVNAALERLAEAVRAVDAVPPEVVAAAKAAFTWRTIDAELAALTFDSREEDVALAGLRGSGPRTLTFEYGEVAIDLEVEEEGDGRTIRGQVAPAPVASVELFPAGSAEPVPVATDDLGRFRAARVPAGPLRLLCRFARPDPLAMLLTEWIVV